jgi:hypothetical protein
VVFDGKGPASPIQIVKWLADGETGMCDVVRPIDRLTVIDAIVALHPDWEPSRDRSYEAQFGRERWLKQLVDLVELLNDCGSAWQVDPESRGLYRRVDAPVVEAWQARDSAEESGRPTAARYLTDAWKTVYGMHSEPTDG